MRPLLVIAVLLAGACVGVSIDYVDFIQHGDIQYVSPFSAGLGRALTDSDLGPEQFRVKQTLARGGHGGGTTPQDGDAAFVPAGQPVYAVRGYAPSFRLAARHDGRLVLYEADSNPTAKTGADLLDIDGRVASIALLSQRDGRTVIGRITEPSRVAELVRVVVTATITRSHPTSAAGMAAIVAFELTDGTVSARGYAVDIDILARDIHAGGAFHDAVIELLANARTPTPVPATVNLARRYGLAAATRITVKRLQPPGAFTQDPLLVARFAAALDVDVPAFPRAPSPPDSTVVIFEFTDHYVSLTYDSAADILTVAAPDDGFAIHPPLAFRELLR